MKHKTSWKHSIVWEYHGRTCTEATNREIFKDVTGDIKIGADSSEVRVGTDVQRKIILGPAMIATQCWWKFMLQKLVLASMVTLNIYETRIYKHSINIRHRRSTRKSVRGDVPGHLR